jgi:hypothetical protein
MRTGLASMESKMAALHYTSSSTTEVGPIRPMASSLSHFLLIIEPVGQRSVCSESSTRSGDTTEILYEDEPRPLARGIGQSDNRPQTQSSARMPDLPASGAHAPSEGCFLVVQGKRALVRGIQGFRCVCLAGELEAPAPESRWVAGAMEHADNSDRNHR